MATPVLAEALVRWQHAAGPFWPYVCAAPFLGTGEGEMLALRVSPSPDGRRPTHSARLAGRLLELERTGDPDGGPIVLLVDLPAEPVLATAPLLVERGWYVVPVVQRWIASPAVLPCRKLVERLVVGAWGARRPTAPSGVVLIADGDRRGSTGYPATVPGRAFDNRYEYQICRFPSVDFLKAQGIERIYWITNGASPAERPVRPDLAPYLEELLRAGLMVDVRPWPL